MFTIQTQFDEYRITAEYLFNVEVAKLEEEIGTQSARYQQEIMYIIQAKDKFYADMMVAKDAKIMSLIEGSDMQTLMQKHELVKTQEEGRVGQDDPLNYKTIIFGLGYRKFTQGAQQGSGASQI